VWSDQLCPNTLTGVGDSVMWICKQTGPAALNADRKERLKTLTGLDDPSKLLNGWRDTKARAFLSLTIEVAVAQNLNLFLIFEGAPGQAERAMDAGMFNSRMLGQTDPIYNGRLGATIKY
jgi:hypothetical protein